MYGYVCVAMKITIANNNRFSQFNFVRTVQITYIRNTDRNGNKWPIFLLVDYHELFNGVRIKRI